MAKAPPVEQQVLNVAALRQRGNTPDVRAELARALESKSNLVVAKAAEVAADLGARELAPQLAEAFARLIDAPLSADKGCVAKTAIARSLNALDASDENVFLRGIRHVQHE